MPQIYLDNAATTKPLEIVKEAVVDTMINNYGNPSSYHKLGLEAEKLIKESSDFFAKVLNCAEDEIIYTSGATESNNMAIIGAALAYKRTGNRVITTSIEHPSVKQAFIYLESLGFEVIYLKTTKTGKVDIQEIESYIDDNTILVSIMHVNNEIGTVQEIDKIGQVIKNSNKNTIFHVDAVQSFGKYQIDVIKSSIDLLSMSAHKIYGPKGVGLLYKNKNIRIKPLLIGGDQQKGLRSGTENVPGIVGMYKAAKYVWKNKEKINENMLELKKTLANKILDNIPGSYINGPSIEEAAAHILNVGFKDIKSEILLHALDAKSIYVSSGSACSSNSKEKSDTLEAIGLDNTQIDEAIRFSFGIYNTTKQMDTVYDALQTNIPMLRKVLKLGGRR